MHTFIHSDLANSTYRNWKNFLGKAENWSSKKIKRYQLKKLKGYVRKAYKLPGYKLLYKNNNFHPKNLKSLNDIKKIPFLTKEMLQSNIASFTFSKKASSYVTTGGSTGTPLGIYRDKKAFWRELASKAHQYHRVNWKEGDRQIVFRGIPIKNRNKSTFVKNLNELRFSSFHLNGRYLPIFFKKAAAYKPVWLRCYPSSGCIFAKWLIENKKTLPTIRGILCASENLRKTQKRLLRKAFRNAKVFSHYGHYELAALAGYCEETEDYHALPFYGFTELVNQKNQWVQRKGRVGEIVASSFIMDATPLIRYKTGDLAKFKGNGCRHCSRPYQIWEKIVGRLQEIIYTKSGNPVSLTAINFHDKTLDKVKNFQFRQDIQGEVTFCYVPKRDLAGSEIETIIKKIQKKIGSRVIVRPKKCNSLLLTKRGKYKALIQNIQQHN